MAVALSSSRAAPIFDTPVWPVRAIPAADTGLGRLAFATLWIFVFVMPWEESVPLLGGFVISRWVALLAFLLLGFNVLLTRRLRRISPIHGLMLALVAWAALTLFWTMDSSMTLTRISTYAQLLLAVWIIWELATTEKRVVSLLRAYLFGAAVMAVDTIINYSRGIQTADLNAEQGIIQYHDQRYSMYGINANDLALMVALSLPIAIYLLARRSRPWTKLYCWLHLGVCLTALFLVGSRGGLIAAGVALLLFPLLTKRMGPLHTAGFLVVCVAGAALGIHFVPPDDWQRILNTPTEITQGTLTHRTILWDAGVDAFRNHPWGGVGAGAYGSAIYKTAGSALVAHDTYISLLVEMGVFGLILFVALLVALFYSARRFAYVERWFWTMFLLTWCTGVLGLAWEYYKPTWFLFGLLAAHACAYRKKTAAA